ncbi:extracellular solute-binding protein [Cohnella sp. CFH 77786]|uniref:ABC transporter substrate-binding protein n=1 Tax=Cohnella sp. CFH 77786 TaxID=2662265 RepID=UPI001C60A4DE|nr:extracellular solute-binding protein [Cohnella sp. CFH 77786]MBW5447474.1 extracellular solute-binding protein [Cohnella sp. CFH 77786]
MKASAAKRVSFLILMLLLIWGTVPAAAEESSGEEAAAPEITFWQTDIWDYTPAIQAYVDEVNPELTVHIATVPLYNYQDKLKIALASGDVPDLILFPNWLLPQFALASAPQSGMFADMNQISEEVVGELQANLARGVWGTVNPPYRQQSVSFIPLNSSPAVWFYRTDLFRQAGLPAAPDAVSAKLNSWNAVEAAGKTFTAKTKKALFGEPSELFRHMLALNGPVYYNMKGVYIGDQNPQIKKAYDYVVNGLKNGWIGRYETGTPAAIKAMKSGAIGSSIGWPGTENQIKDRFGKAGSGKWAVAPLPEGSTDSGILSGAIPADAHEPAIALDLLHWLASEKMQNWAYHELGLFPANLKVLSEPEWLAEKDAYFGNQQVNRVLAQAAKTAKPDALSQELYPAPDAYDNAISKLVRNAKADPAKEWAAAVKTAKSRAVKR